MVFKAHLKWHRTAETEIVAVKTMKGILLWSTKVVSNITNYYLFARTVVTFSDYNLLKNNRCCTWYLG